MEKAKAQEVQFNIEKGKAGLLNMRIGIESSAKDKLQKQLDELREETQRLRDQT